MFKTCLPAEPTSSGSHSGGLVFLGNSLWGTPVCLSLIFFFPPTRGLLKGEGQECPLHLAISGRLGLSSWGGGAEHV